MKHLVLFTFFLCCFGFISLAQSKSFTIERGASVRVSDLSEDWNPVLQENEGEVADEHRNNDQLNLLKQQMRINLLKTAAGLPPFRFFRMPTLIIIKRIAPIGRMLFIAMHQFRIMNFPSAAEPIM